MPKYTFTSDMREISGFGGGYEDCCRKMIVAGMEWFDAHPAANPAFHGFKNITGIIMEDNEDAKALVATMLAAADGDATGAMVQFTVSHTLFARKIGWDAYCKMMQEAAAKEADHAN